MKPDVTAIGIGRGITIMASELCNGPTLHELFTCLTVINEVPDATVHILKDFSLTCAIAAPSGLVVGLRAFETSDGIVLVSRRRVALSDEARAVIRPSPL